MKYNYIINDLNSYQEFISLGNFLEMGDINCFSSPNVQNNNITHFLRSHLLQY
jgi:hypothetical protein